MADLKEPAWLKTEFFVVVVFPGKSPKSLDLKGSTAQKVLKQLDKKDYRKVWNLIFPEERMSKNTKGKIAMDRHGSLVDSKKVRLDPIIKSYLDKIPKKQAAYKALIKLSENIQGAKTPWVRDQLARFLRTNLMPVTNDGCFIAYKYVRENDDGGLVDAHTGDLDNNVGDTLALSDSECDWDPHVTCSKGLHVAAWGYAAGGGDVRVACKVNPSDVVSVPYDYNNQKMRCRKYTVIARDVVKPHSANDIHVGTVWDLSEIKGITKDVPAKKKVGRPRKVVAEEVGTPKRGKGRPRKVAEELPQGKRGRGRPRKVAVKSTRVVKVPLVLSNLSCEELIRLMESVTNVAIMRRPSLKAKANAIKKAVEIFKDQGFRVEHYGSSATFGKESMGNVVYLPLHVLPVKNYRVHDFRLMSAKAIIEYLHKLTGVLLTADPKNKSNVVKYAKAVLKDKKILRYKF